MIPAGNKAKRLSSVNHTTKTIHDHHHHRVINSSLFVNVAATSETTQEEIQV